MNKPDLPSPYLENAQTDAFSTENWFSIGKKYFPRTIKQEINFSGKIREVLKVMAASTDASFDDLLIMYDEAPVYWCLDTQLSLKLKAFYRANYPNVNGVDQYRYIKEQYANWIKSKPDAKGVIARTTISNMDKVSSKTNFLSLIYRAIILSYEKGMADCNKSEQLFKSASDIIFASKLNRHEKEELEFLIHLYSGFCLIINSDYAAARVNFHKSLTIQPENVTAKFHLALAEASLGYRQSVETVFKEIFNYDILKAEGAIELSEKKLIYCLENTFTGKMFIYKQFAILSEEVEGLFSIINSCNIPQLDDLRNRNLRVLEHLKAYHFNTELVKPFIYLQQLIENPVYTNSILFQSTAHKLKNYFIASVNCILDSIREKHTSSMLETLSFYDSKIKEINISIDSLSKEKAGIADELKKKLEEKILATEKEYSLKIQNCEETLVHLNEEPGLSPKLSFGNAMTYNIIISFVIFFLGGCAGYSGSYVSEVSEIKNVLSVTLLSAFKWGLLTFIAGIGISAFIAGLAFLERSNRKQKIVQQISSLKTKKERQINDLRSEEEDKKAVLDKRYNEVMNEHEIKKTEIIKEQRAKETELKLQNEKSIIQDSEPIIQFISGY